VQPEGAAVGFSRMRVQVQVVLAELYLQNSQDGVPYFYVNPYKLTGQSSNSKNTRGTQYHKPLKTMTVSAGCFGVLVAKCLRLALVSKPQAYISGRAVGIPGFIVLPPSEIETYATQTKQRNRSFTEITP
jgi:hypothetical protein